LELANALLQVRLSSSTQAALKMQDRKMQDWSLTDWQMWQIGNHLGGE